MPAAEQIHFSTALVDEWEDLLMKEAAPSAGQFLRQGGRLLSRAAGGAGRAISGAVRGQLGSAGKYLRDPKMQEIWKGRAGGMAVGSGLGAIRGAARAEEGRKGKGALRGAIQGATLGLAGGQLATGAGRRQVGRLMQHQAHGLTGYMPRTEEQIAAGASRFGRGWSPEARVKAVEAMRGELTPEMRAAAEKGLTSIPGIAKGLVTKGDRLETLKRTALSSGKGGLAFSGIMAAPGIVSAAKSGDPESVGQAIGSTAGYTVGAPLPYVGNLALGSVGGRVGGAIGRGVGYLTGRTAPRSE